MKIERGKKAGEIEQFSNMPKIVWLTGFKLTKYKDLLAEFGRYQNSQPKRKATRPEETFHVWSKGGGYDWQSDNEMLISIQATEDFADYLSQRFGTRVTDKKTK